MLYLEYAIREFYSKQLYIYMCGLNCVYFLVP